MASVTREIVILLVLVFVNGLLAMSEIAIVSSRRARLQELAKRGVRGAALALQLAQEPTQFLATVQIGITLVGIVAGAYAGVTIGEELGVALRQIPALAAHSEFLGIGIVVTLTTYVSLVFGELLPKRLALGNRETLAVRAAPPMWLLQRLVSPVVWLLTISTSLFLRLLRAHRTTDTSVTEEELVTMVREGAEEGVFESTERDMIEGVLELDALPVGAVMTPRPRAVWLDIASPSEELLRVVVESGYTRYPVCEGSLDAVRGALNAKTLLAEHWRTGAVDVARLARPATFIPERASALVALRLLREAEVRLALVVDEYGDVQGVCTLNDILRPLVGGELMGPEAPAPLVIRRADGSYLVDGMLPMHELADYLEGLLEADAKEGFPFYTVAGLAMSELGAIPRPGDSFVWRGLCIEVLDMDRHRVDKVLVTPCAPQTTDR